MSPSPIASGANPAEAGGRGGIEALSNRRLSVSKRLVDQVVACVAIVLLSPILLAAAVMVKLTSPGPVFFRQTRIGQAERPFVMLKLTLCSRRNSDHQTTRSSSPPSNWLNRAGIPEQLNACAESSL